jgi:hypothetical protein
MIATDGFGYEGGNATRARPEPIHGFWASTCANATPCRSTTPSQAKPSARRCSISP